MIPSARCGDVVDSAVSIRKKWQNLWISWPRKRKYQSIVSIEAAQRELVEPRLLAHFAQRRVLGRFASLDVPFGKPPVLVAVANEEEERHARRRCGRRRRPRTSRRVARARVMRDVRRAAAATAGTLPSSSVGRPSMNCRTTGSVVCWISSTVPTCRTRPW